MGLTIIMSKSIIFLRERGDTVKIVADFTGFSKELIDFLWELRFNNNKEWFDENRDRYRVLFKEPMDSFAAEVGNAIAEKTGRKAIPAVSRINRDIRFSKNKEPYRDHKWIVFKREEGPWTAKPAIFFEIGPDYYMLGMGIYENLPAYMKAFRKKIDANTPVFERLIKKYDKSDMYSLVGDFYKKKLGDKSPEIMNWYQRKGIALIGRREIEEILFSRELVNFCAEQFEYLMPIMDFMYDVTVE